MSAKHLMQIIAAIGAFILFGSSLAVTFRLRKRHAWAKWAFRITITLLVLLFLFMLAFKRPNPFFNENAIPKIVTANVVDIKDVYQVSKYRSGVGHDYPGNGETCRSMKHYINVSHTIDPITHQAVRSKHTAEHPNILVHAPFDGFILSTSGSHLGQQVDIVPWQNLFYTVRLDHMDLAPGMHALSWVKSGQVIGTIGPSDPLDISVFGGDDFNFGGYGHLASYFVAMTDKAFAPWAAAGYQRNDFIITKAYRDAHPMKCSSDPDSDAFVYPPGQNGPTDYDWVFVRPDPFGYIFGAGPSPQAHYGPPAR